jgi:hypothetical protein
MSTLHAGKSAISYSNIFANSKQNSKDFEEKTEGRKFRDTVPLSMGES